LGCGILSPKNVRLVDPNPRPPVMCPRASQPRGLLSFLKQRNPLTAPAVKERFWLRKQPPRTCRVNCVCIIVLKSTLPPHVGRGGRHSESAQSILLQCSAKLCSWQRERPQDSSISISTHFAILAHYSRVRQVHTNRVKDSHTYIIFIIRVKINFPVFTSRSTYNRVFKTIKVNVPINSIFDIGKSITIEPAVNFQTFTHGFVISSPFFDIL